MDIHRFRDAAEFQDFRPFSSPFEQLFFSLKLLAAHLGNMASQWFNYFLITASAVSSVISEPSALQPTPPMGKWFIPMSRT